MESIVDGKARITKKSARLLLPQARIPNLEQLKELRQVELDLREAEAIGAAEEARIRDRVLNAGAVEPVRLITVGECIAAYTSRPGGLHPFDLSRLAELDAAGIGPLRQQEVAW